MKISEISFKDSSFTYLQYIKRLAACLTYVQNYAIFPKTPKLPSLRTPGPVFVHRQNNISPGKRSTQTDVSATLLQYIKRLAACLTYVQNYAIFPKTPKLPSLRTPGPVFVHRQNNISPGKRSTQTDVSATLLRAYRAFSSICQ